MKPATNGENGARSVWKGFLSGMFGGLVASWTMNQFQKIWTVASESQSNRKSINHKEGGEDATVRTAERISSTMRGKGLTKDEKRKAGPAGHYAFGALMGGLYGVAVEIKPEVKSMKGLPYGTALFVGADEVALPALGLSKSPTTYPFSRHVFGMVSRLVYGATVERIRRTVRKHI